MGEERIIVVSDKETAGLRERVKAGIEQSSSFEVVCLSRVKISRIRQEIVPQKPSLVFVSAFLFHPEEFRELKGFVKKLKKHLPQTKIIVHTPRLDDVQLKEIFALGVEGWIDERLGYEFLGKATEAILEGKQTFPSSQVIGKEYPRLTEALGDVIKDTR